MIFSDYIYIYWNGLKLISSNYFFYKERHQQAKFLCLLHLEIKHISLPVTNDKSNHFSTSSKHNPSVGSIAINITQHSHEWLISILYTVHNVLSGSCYINWWKTWPAVDSIFFMCVCVTSSFVIKLNQQFFVHWQKGTNAFTAILHRTKLWKI